MKSNYSNWQSILKKRAASPLITGTLLLSGAGLASRLIGFFYKIFLSRAIGAENLGLYQLAFPVLSLGMSLTSSGIQTALSRAVAGAQNQHSLKNAATFAHSAQTVPEQGAGNRTALQHRYFMAAAMLSLGLAALFSVIVLWKSNWIASELLGDERCAPLLVAAVCSLFPGCLHACMNGYYFGKKEATIPAASQFAEQVGRVGAVYLVFRFAAARGESIGAIHAMWGVAIGECFGVVVTVAAMLWHKFYTSRQHTASGASATSGHSTASEASATSYAAGQHTASGASATSGHSTDSKSCAASLSLPCAIGIIGSIAFPMTFNRVIISICHSVENALLPQQLALSGMTQSAALFLYGILSGMALSVIHFPSVLTGSLSDLLLPSVSEAFASGQRTRIAHLIRRSVTIGLSFGFLFTIFFLLCGDFIGSTLFDSAAAGEYIRRLAFVCPFLYLSGLLGSILHGLGRPRTVLFINLLSCLIRIAFILLLVPSCGVGAYLWSMLLSQVFCATGSLAALWEYM